jgi:hypothetical protein
MEKAPAKSGMVEYEGTCSTRKNINMVEYEKESERFILRRENMHGS